MVPIVFLSFLFGSRGQNEEIRTEDFMNFSNPIDSRENRKTQNINHFIELNHDLEGDNLQESYNLADIHALEQNNMASDSFCEIPYDSSFMNIENIPSKSLFDPTSDQKLLYDEIEFFLDSTSFEMPNPAIGTPAYSFEPECQCVGLCLCITTQKPDINPIDIDSAYHIYSDILSSDIILTNKQDQKDEMKNKDILQCESSQIECETEANLNSTEQSNEQTIYQNTTENILSPVQNNIFTLQSSTRLNHNNPEQIEKLYLDYLNKMAETSQVETNFLAKRDEIQSTVQPSTSQEIVIPGLKNEKKRKYPEEKNEIDESETMNNSMSKKTFPCFHSGESQTCSNRSENKLLVNQAKTIYDPDGRDYEEELDFHLKNCNYYAHSQLKRLIIKINYENSQITNVKYVTIQSNQKIPKTEKSKKILYIFGTFIYKPSTGGSTFTVRVPKLFEDEAQFENNEFRPASAFVQITTDDEYNLTLKMSRINVERQLPTVSFKLDNGAELVPNRFYAYHFKQVIRFEINRRANGRVYYIFEYKPEKDVSGINS
ncbi:hypothetical protein M153_3400019056 [Pseudoloma neurophilia]|uniref:Uncharacterized protein n=1 Tax=Pseudoloma neurophilia TaxID=146866 RepID=A0A0R0M0K7_9MICR|nr:hypothetical protein M153_3400019056 [Pseudoloma neurophilia]